MVSPGWIARRIHECGFKLLEWSDRWNKNELDDAPKKSGVYALYFGNTIQYIGKSENLQSRLKEWERRHHFENDYVPFGSFAWFRVPKNQVSRVESDLIGYYQPRYNERLL